MLNFKWKNILFNNKNIIILKKIKKFLLINKKKNKIIYPNFNNIFNTFKFTKFNELKIVIIGQDPYYKKNQANGLCFSVNKNIIIPPTLHNIYKEIKRDIKNFKYPKHGYLKKWSKQGILLLNSILSVEKNKPLSHSNIGWEDLIKNIIIYINNYKEKIIFLLWGKYVQNNFINLINKKKHYILTSSHPSPFSFKNGFWGCGHFSKINNILEKNKKKIINWQI